MIKRIKVITNAKKERVEENGEIKVYVKERPEKGKANRAVEKLLSEYFGRKVKIIKGLKSSKKTVEVI